MAPAQRQHMGVARGIAEGEQQVGTSRLGHVGEVAEGEVVQADARRVVAALAPHDAGDAGKDLVDHVGAPCRVRPADVAQHAHRDLRQHAERFRPRSFGRPQIVLSPILDVGVDLSADASGGVPALDHERHRQVDQITAERAVPNGGQRGFDEHGHRAGREHRDTMASDAHRVNVPAIFTLSTPGSFNQAFEVQQQQRAPAGQQEQESADTRPAIPHAGAVALGVTLADHREHGG